MSEWVEITPPGYVMLYRVIDRELKSIALAQLLCDEERGKWTQAATRWNMWPGREEAWEEIEAYPPRIVSGDGLIDWEAGGNLTAFENWTGTGEPVHPFLEARLRRAVDELRMLSDRDDAGEWDVLIAGRCKLRREGDGGSPLPAWATPEGDEYEPPDSGFRHDWMFETDE